MLFVYKIENELTLGTIGYGHYVQNELDYPQLWHKNRQLRIRVRIPFITVIKNT